MVTVRMIKRGQDHRSAAVSVLWWWRSLPVSRCIRRKTSELHAN